MPLPVLSVTDLIHEIGDLHLQVKVRDRRIIELENHIRRITPLGFTDQESGEKNENGAGLLNTQADTAAPGAGT